MARPELGLKRICPNCSAKYYDLNRSPILCPRCGAPFDTSMALKAKAAGSDDEDDLEEEETAGVAEFVSLDDVVAEENDPDVADIEDADIEDVGPEDDDQFLEDEEDEGDVSDIIGDVGEEEER